MCNYREDVPAIVSHDDAHDYKSKKFHQTAEQGNTTTLFNLVLMYALDKGVPKNTEKADTYMKQACSKGNQGAVRHMAKLIH